MRLEVTPHLTSQSCPSWTLGKRVTFVFHISTTLPARSHSERSARLCSFTPCYLSFLFWLWPLTCWLSSPSPISSTGTISLAPSQTISKYFRLNSDACGCFFHHRQLHTPTNVLLLSLAVADFVIGLVMPFQMLITDGCWILGDVMCTLVCILEYTTTSASVGTIMLISADRYVAICYPLHYSTKITVRQVTIGNCLCWAFSALYNSLIMLDNLTHPGKYNSCFGECVVVISYHSGIVDIILTFICPVLVIVVLYTRVFMVAVSQARAMRSHTASVTLSQTLTATKMEMKAARTLGIVVIVFLTCLCPYFCSSLVSQETLFSVTSVPVENWLFYFNSCLNPLIYVFYYPWFLKSIKLILTCRIFQSDSSQLNVLWWKYRYHLVCKRTHFKLFVFIRRGLLNRISLFIVNICSIVLSEGVNTLDAFLLCFVYLIVHVIHSFHSKLCRVERPVISLSLCVLVRIISFW